MSLVVEIITKQIWILQTCVGAGGERARAACICSNITQQWGQCLMEGTISTMTPCLIIKSRVYSRRWIGLSLNGINEILKIIRPRIKIYIQQFFPLVILAYRICTQNCLNSLTHIHYNYIASHDLWILHMKITLLVMISEFYTIMSWKFFMCKIQRSWLAI